MARGQHPHRWYQVGREGIAETPEARLHHMHRPFDPLRLQVFSDEACVGVDQLLRRCNPAGGHVFTSN